ncbi:MAG TPA: PQQ-binding-like beta-propeller repeat protein [Phycisphaerae bacterium]|nr:PQQ-binding-like beta-propeller repeat protein [Phycisphaerae bacterium]
MRLTFRRGLVGLCVLTTVAATALPAPGDEKAPWWPQLHGPRRDNISPDRGLLKAWPKEGPKLLWQSAECGGGYAGVSIADGRIHIAGDFGEKEAILALGLDGTVRWKAGNGRSWKGPYPGARTTPTYDKGVLYHMNPHGRLAAMKADSGEEIWAVDLAEKFATRPANWALAENILIDGDVLYCAPAGQKGRVVALKKADGSTLWANTEIADGPAYCSPILVEYGGARQLVTVLEKTIVGVDVGTGKLLWQRPHVTKHGQNVTRPTYSDGHIYSSSGHGTGGQMLRLAADGQAVTELWLNKDMDNCHGGVLLLDGRLYGHGCRLYKKGFVCVDFRTGKTLWTEPKLGKVSVSAADGMIYCISDRGKVSLVEPGADACRIAGEFNLPKGPKGLTLTHPVICGGVLYLRHWETLYAYDVRAASQK